MTDVSRVPESVAYAHRRVWSQEIPARNAHFTGREAELETLRGNLATSSVGVLSQPPLAIFGLGGIGKTEIAVEYAHRHAGEYQIVWWVRAEHEDRIRDSFVRLGRRLDLALEQGQQRDQSIWAVLDVLRTGVYDRWLLIFDNATDPAVIRKYLPDGPPHGHVIITSRERQWRRHTRAEGIEVAKFATEETIAFLRSRVRALAPLSGFLDPAGRQEEQRRQDDAAKLAGALDNLPIALEHAAAYLTEEGIGVDDYLKLFEQNAQELLSEPVDMDYPEAVATTWSVSVRKLGDDAIELFNLCSFFSPEPVAEELFHSGSSDVQGPAGLVAVLSDFLRVRAALRRMHRLSLAKIDGKRNVVQLHRVVQAVTRGQIAIERPGAVAEYRAAVHALLASSDPRNPDRETNDVQYDRSLQHLRPSGAIDTDNPKLRILIINQVRRLHLRGGHEEAVRLGEEALKVWRDKLGPTDLQVLELSVEVGIALRPSGRRTDARVLNKETLDLLREHYGPKNEVTLTCANSYGGDLRGLGRFKEALEQDLALLSLFEEVFLPEHERTLNVLNNIAVDYRQLGDFAKALEYDQRTYTERQRLFGATYLRTLASKDSAAQDMRLCGLYEQALDLARDVMSVFEDWTGSLNLDWLNAQKGFAVSLRRAGYHEQGLAEMRQVVQRYSDYVGPSHHSTLRAGINLISDLRVAQDLHGAERQGRLVLEQSSAVDVPKSDITYAAMVNLAVVLRLLNRPTEAQTLDRQAYEALSDLYGAEHLFTLTAATNLASDLSAVGQTAEARELGERLLETSSRTLDPTHPATLAIAANLSLDRRATGDAQSAAELLAETLDHYQATLSMEHADARAAKERGRVNVDIEPF